MYIKTDTLDDLLRESFELILNEGTNCEGSKGRYLELLGVSLELTNPRSRLSRTEVKGHIFSCLGEFFWYLSGSSSGDAISYYISGYKDFVEQDNTVGGAYGPRLFGYKDGYQQFSNLIDLVKNKPSTRQAVIQIFDEQDLHVPRKKEIPCTLSLQFLLRNDELHMIVSMRSNDAYVGLPHDLFCFTMLQELFVVAISNELKRPIRLGRYKHFVSTLHIYEKNLEDVRDFLNEGFTSTQDIMQEMPSDSFVKLKELVDIENMIRNRHEFRLSKDTIGTYWHEIFELLNIYSVYKDNNLNYDEKVQSIQTIKSRINNLGYHQFVVKKLQELQKREKDV